MEELVQRLNAICDDQPYWTGWYLKDLRTGAAANRNGDTVVPSASTRKIAILMTALKQVNEGTLSLDQPLELTTKYQYTNSGVYQHLTAPTKIPFRDALVLMIIVSDNVCTGTVADTVGLDNINALCQSIGMVGTTHRHSIPDGIARDHAVDATNATTANDVGLILDLILQGTTDAEAAAKLGCTPELCQLAMDIMSWQKLRQRLPAKLPQGTKVAHKTGTGARNNNDAGIIFDPNGSPAYILTVYTDELPVNMPERHNSGFGNASEQIAEMSRACWDALVEPQG